MNKKFVAVIIAVILLMIVWVGLGFEGNELPYVTIGNLTEKKFSKPGKRFRLGGNVLEGSIIRSKDDPLALSFVLIQEKEQLAVSYRGSCVMLAAEQGHRSSLICLLYGTFIFVQTAGLMSLS